MTSPVDRLKELLFDSEAQRLADMHRRQGAIELRVEQVFNRAGTEEYLQKSVAGIIDGALRDAEVVKHEPLARAIAPLVLKTIKTELKNAKPELVAAVYPMTGTIVKQYVQAAMADLVADINRKLSGKQLSDLEARAKSLGVPVSDLVLAEMQALKVDELFLVKRGSGDLVAHWERPLDDGVVTSGHGSNRDTLIAGYLTGITAFSEEAFDETKGSLRAIDMDGQRIFIRASPTYLLAARCSGSAPQSVERIINDEFVKILSAVQDQAGGAAAATKTVLPTVATSLATRFDEERKRIERAAEEATKPQSFLRFYLMAAAVLLPLIGWLGWQTWRGWQVQRVVTEARSVLAGDAALRGYPMAIEASDGGRRLSVSGLTPSADVRGRFLETLRRVLPETRVEDGTSVLPQPVDADSRERLNIFARDHAIFFANGAELADARAATVAIERLVGLMRGNDAVMRVIGYTDDSGNPAANQQLAQARADRVAELLLAQGVGKERLAVIGRGSGRDVSRGSGPGSANRRVSFELAYIGEPTP